MGEGVVDLNNVIVVNVHPGVSIVQLPLEAPAISELWAWNKKYFKPSARGVLRVNSLSFITLCKI